MKSPLLPLLALCLTPLIAPAAIRINEVHYNVNGPDLNYEFIELKSTTNGVESCAGLSLVIINTALSDNDGIPQNPGEILEVLDLNELSTGPNGLLLLGNGYTDAPAGGPWSGNVDPNTAMGDPSGLGDSDIKTNTGFNLFLIRNYNAVAGPKGADIDRDTPPVGANAISTGNGVIDWKQTPVPAGGISTPLWADADIIDSIGTRDGKDNGDNLIGTRPSYVPPGADLTTFAVTFEPKWGSTRDPDTCARQLGNNTPNNAASFYGGQMNDANPTPTDILYRVGRTFGPGNMVGQVTPGRANQAATLPTTDFRINEVNLNPSGTSSADNRYQYIEIINTDGQSRSLSGYWLVLLDSYDATGIDNTDVTGVGNIIEEWNLSDFATGSNGLLLLGDGFSPTYTLFQDAVSPNTAIGDPAGKTTSQYITTGWSLGDLKYKDGFTLLLVKGYSPPLTRNLDQLPKDGVLDSAPWTSISDQIGFTQINKTTLGRTYSAVDLRGVMNSQSVPDSFSRKLGNLANNSNLAWYGGNFPGGSSPMTLGFEDTAKLNAGDTFSATWFGSFRGAATPGMPNLSAAINPTAPPIAASIRINEVMINPTDDITSGNDKSNEYIELASTNEALAYMDGLHVLVVDMKGTVGNIVTGFPLDGYTTGTNGIVLLGDGYDNNNGPYASILPGGEGTLPPASAAFDPVVGLEQNEIPNNGCAILLVRGVKGLVSLNPNGKPIGDLCPLNDGVLVAPSLYTNELVDSIVVNNINPGAGYGWIDSSAFPPHHIARYPGNFTPSNAASWYFGQIPQGPASPPLTNYTGSYSGAFQGAGSPGRPNHAATPGPTGSGDVVFNEINFNPAGADGNFEFLELLSTNGAARSLNGYSILAIDNQISNTGAIRHAWSLDGMATGPNGLFVLGNRYPINGQNPWAHVMRAQTRTGDTAGREGLDSSFNDGSLGAESLNLNVTWLLVRNFNKYLDYDLDDKTNGNVDSPGDGVFDSFPWVGGILDSVMLRSYAPTVPPPAVPTAPYPYDGWTYGLANLTAAFFPTPTTLFYHPESIARFLGENTANDPTAWYGGDLKGGSSGNDGNAESYISSTDDPTHPPRPDGFWGRITPGQPNLARSASADPDGDGIPNLVEQAINTNPAAPSSVKLLPLPALINDAGQNYLGFSYPRITTTANPLPVPYAAEAYVYSFETSPNLTTWTPAPAIGAGAMVPVGSPVAAGDGVTETATVRLPVPVTAPSGRNYVRLRITRR